MKRYICTVRLILCSLISYSQVPDSVAVYSPITDSATIYSRTADSAIVAIQSERQPIKRTDKVYNIKPWLDIPLTLATDAWSIYGMSVIYGRDPVPDEEILALNKNDINEFDRPSADRYSTKAKEQSDYFFYGSMPLPLFLMLDKKIRKDGVKVILLYLESMGITGTIYTASAMIANRFRPYAYNPNVPMNTRKRGGARNSFFAGHIAVVATSTFFTAQVYSHYHPNMKGKWILYTVAGGIAATAAYLRFESGQHFKTDIITGFIVGTLVGNLVPHFHRNKSFNNQRLTVVPSFNTNSTGVTAFYKLGR